MAFRFRKRIKIAPGVHINLSKGGVSTSIGGRGATVNFGKEEVKGTVGIPGTGLSYSEKLSGHQMQADAGLGTELTAEGSSPRRRVGLMLGLGILLMPYLFVWALLRSGHSTMARILGFGWIAFLVFAAVQSSP